MAPGKKIPPNLEKSEKPKGILKYAAIDIGSNAVRLLLANAFEADGEMQFKKSELVRVPLRLGEDVFLNGKISPAKANLFIKTMQAFRLLIDVFDPVAYRACATASLRDASNGEELVKLIRKESGINIEIITGKHEAELIYANHVEEHLDPRDSFLYIDVGGGSTEVTLFEKGRCMASRSFEIGTLRWLRNQVPETRWNGFKEWITFTCKNSYPLTAIGSGGNINKIFKMIGRPERPLPVDKLRTLYEELKPLSVDARIRKYGLNPDRADVIVPAAKIYLSVMKAAGIKEILVPQIGLSDGIIHRLHEDHKQARVA